jgi:hypothetical protein
VSVQTEFTRLPAAVLRAANHLPNSVAVVAADAVAAELRNRLAEIRPRPVHVAAHLRYRNRLNRKAAAAGRIPDRVS